MTLWHGMFIVGFILLYGTLSLALLGSWATELIEALKATPWKQQNRRFAPHPVRQRTFSGAPSPASRVLDPPSAELGTVFFSHEEGRL